MAGSNMCRVGAVSFRQPNSPAGIEGTGHNASFRVCRSGVVTVGPGNLRGIVANGVPWPRDKRRQFFRLQYAKGIRRRQPFLTHRAQGQLRLREVGPEVDATMGPAIGSRVYPVHPAQRNGDKGAGFLTLSLREFRLRD